MGIVLSPETGQQVGQGGLVGGVEPPCPDELELPAELGVLLAEFRLDDWLDVLVLELPDFDDDWWELLAELRVDARLDDVWAELPEEVAEIWLELLGALELLTVLEVALELFVLLAELRPDEGWAELGVELVEFVDDWLEVVCKELLGAPALEVELVALLAELPRDEGLDELGPKLLPEDACELPEEVDDKLLRTADERELADGSGLSV